MKIGNALSLAGLAFFGLIFCAEAQVTAPPGETPPSEKDDNGLRTMPIYLRIADLAPISQGLVSVMRGDEPYAAGVSAGYIQNYTALAKKGGLTFSVVRTDNQQNIGTFDLKMPEKKNEEAYFTLVITGEKGAFKAQLFEDTQKSGVDGTPAPKRLRVFIGGLDFTMTVTAEKWGTWKSEGNSILETIQNGGPPPKMIGLNFVNRDNEQVNIYFPPDFESYSSNTVFVSQRGEKRARIQVFPDSTPPKDESGKAQALE